MKKQAQMGLLVNYIKHTKKKIIDFPQCHPEDRSEGKLCV
jgi:hypothetical protein